MTIKKKCEKRKIRSVVPSCKAGGLGAFVGITKENTAPENLSKKSSTRRFVSPLENDLSKISDIPVHNQKVTSSLVAAGLTVNSPASEETPPVTTLIIPQQSERSSVLASPETNSATVGELQTSSEAHGKIKEEKRSHPKYDTGISIKKEFNLYGWFTGTIIAYDSETAYYKVRYEDGDIEELEEEEIQPVEVTGSKLIEQRQSMSCSQFEEHKNLWFEGAE